VVTSDCLASHNPEIEALKDGVNGLLYERGKVSAFADSILQILGGARNREQWRRAALDTVNLPGGYSLESMVQGFAEALHFALTRTARRISNTTH
jgi:hypothetical protein